METKILIKIDPVENWLSQVAYSRSGSSHTQKNYRSHLQWFCEFIGVSAVEIKVAYDNIETFNQERKFKDKFAQAIQAWINALRRQGLTTKTISVYTGAIKSFFKHNRIPLGFLPTPQTTVTYHNRDISRQEITDIVNVSLPRDKAYYLIMAQSGLRPHTVSKLKLKDIEYDRLKKGESPVKIEVTQKNSKGKYKAYWSFISNEAIQALDDYLKTRRNLTKESLLFTQIGTEDKPVKPATMSSQFGKCVRMLKDRGNLDFEVRFDKPSELRLYNLRKFFDNQASPAGFEYKEFWMGHKLKTVHNYISRDPEHHRQLYVKKASLNLTIFGEHPSETAQAIESLKESYEEKIQNLQQDYEKKIESLKRAYKERETRAREYEKSAFAKLKEQEDALFQVRSFIRASGISNWKPEDFEKLKESMKKMQGESD